MTLAADYTFFAIYDSVETELFPVVNTLLFQDTLDDDAGVLRRTLETELEFNNKNGSLDFDYLYDIETSLGCGRVEFQIKYKGETKYNAFIRFGSNKLRFDVSKCTVFVKLDINDEYSCLFDAWEREIDILDGTTKVELFSILGELEETECQAYNETVFSPFVSDCLPDALGWVVKQHSDMPFIGSTYEHRTTWVREKVTTDCFAGSPVQPPGTGWILLEDNCPTNSTWVRSPQRTFDSENSYIDEPAGELLSIWKITLEQLPEKFRNAVRLDEVLEMFNPCETAIIARFFSYGSSEEEPVPDNEAYDSARENLRDVLIFQKTDVRNPEFSNSATDGKWTYKALIQHLRNQFNLKFVLNPFFRLEHVSYFEEKAQGIDLTQEPYAKHIEGLFAYSYDNSEVARREVWQWQENNSGNFQGVPIEYDCAGEDDQEEKVFALEDINNDVGYIVNNPSKIEDYGFVFVNAYKDGSDNYYLTSEENELTGDTDVNGHLSIPNLQQKYWRWGRPLPTGEMNNDAITFESVLNRKVQVELSVQMPRSVYHNDFDPNDLVKTQIGWGEVVSARYDARTCYLTLTVRHA